MVYSKIIDKQIIITDPYSCSCHVIPIKKNLSKQMKTKNNLPKESCLQNFGDLDNYRIECKSISAKHMTK